MRSVNATRTEGWSFSPLFILPSQTDTTRQWSPEKRLLFAVFQNAMLTLSRGRKRVAKGKPDDAYGETLAWVASEERGPISFLTLCEIFDISPERVRRQVTGNQVEFKTRAYGAAGTGYRRHVPIPGRRQVA